jgi:hypothetical protein
MKDQSVNNNNKTNISVTEYVFRPISVILEKESVSLIYLAVHFS